MGFVKMWTLWLGLFGGELRQVSSISLQLKRGLSYVLQKNMGDLVSNSFRTALLFKLGWKLTKGEDGL